MIMRLPHAFDSAQRFRTFLGIGRRLPDDSERAFAAWLTTRDRGQQWPVDRMNWNDFLPALVRALQDCHREARQNNARFTDVLDIVGTRWLATIGYLYHYRRLLESLPENERESMPRSIFRVLHQMAGAGLPDEPYVDDLAVGPVRLARWRVAARMTRQILTESPLSARPLILIDRHKATVTLSRTATIECHAAMRGVRDPVYYCDLAIWFPDPISRTIVSEDAWEPCLLTRLLEAVPEIGEVLTADDAAWLDRNMSRAAHLINVRLADLRKAGPSILPATLWIGTSSDVWSKMLGKVMKEAGRTVVAHDHGAGAGCFEPDPIALGFSRVITHFASDNGALAARAFARYALDLNDVPEVVALPQPPHPKFACRVMQSKGCTGQGAKVLYLPLTVAAEVRNFYAYPDSPVNFEFDRQIAEWFCGREDRLIFKPHPEMGLRHCQHLAEETNSEILTGPFEQILGGIDVVLFPFATSTTFKYCLDREIPFVFIDFGFATMSAAFRELVRARGNIVPGHMDGMNRLRCDFAALDLAIRGSASVAKVIPPEAARQSGSA